MDNPLELKKYKKYGEVDFNEILTKEEIKAEKIKKLELEIEKIKNS